MIEWTEYLHFDPQVQRSAPYYHNSSSGATQWQQPAAPYHRAAIEWAEYLHPDRPVPFYVNGRNGMTQWQPPAAPYRAAVAAEAHAEGLTKEHRGGRLRTEQGGDHKAQAESKGIPGKEGVHGSKWPENMRVCACTWATRSIAQCQDIRNTASGNNESSALDTESFSTLGEEPSAVDKESSALDRESCSILV